MNAFNHATFADGVSSTCHGLLSHRCSGWQSEQNKVSALTGFPFFFLNEEQLLI